MNKSFTSNHYINLTDQFQKDLQCDIALTLKKVYKGAKPGKMALKNVLGFASSLDVVETFSSGNQLVIVN